jgi:hypothetical protein
VVKKSIMVNFLKNSSIILNMVPNNIYVTKWIIKKLKMWNMCSLKFIYDSPNYSSNCAFHPIGNVVVINESINLYEQEPNLKILKTCASKEIWNKNLQFK